MANKPSATKKKIFISFDFENDRALKNEIVGYSQNGDAGFKVAGWSMKPENINTKWLKEAKYRISKCDALLVLTGEHTTDALGVKKELEIAKSAGIKIIHLTAHPQYKAVEGAGDATDMSLEGLKGLLS